MGNEIKLRLSDDELIDAMFHAGAAIGLKAKKLYDERHAADPQLTMAMLPLQFHKEALTLVWPALGTKVGDTYVVRKPARFQ